MHIYLSPFVLNTLFHKKIDVASSAVLVVILPGNNKKDKIAYVTLDPVSDYVYISDLILDSELAEKCYLTKFIN